MSAALAAAIPQQRRARLELIAGDLPDSPLRLLPGMRKRFRRAVAALLDSGPRLSDPAALVLLVIVAKLNFASGRLETSVPELSDWTGTSGRTVDSALAELRNGARIESQQIREDKKVVGLKVRIPAVDNAQRCPGSALALTRVELSVLLRFLEAVIGPGWESKGITPGLMARREGKGACTDRLAAVRVILSARSNGRLRMAGGKLTDTRRSRAAHAVARLMGCTPLAADHILTRLEAHGLVVALRTATTSGMVAGTVYEIPAIKPSTSVSRSRRYFGQLSPAAAEPVTRENAGESLKGRSRRYFGATHLHAPLADVVVQVEEVDGSSAEGALRLSHDGGYAREATSGDGALRAEASSLFTVSQGVHHVVSEIPGLMDRLSKGQKLKARSMIRSVLTAHGYTAQDLADHLTSRLACMSLTDAEFSGYISSPFGWLRIQLPDLVRCSCCSRTTSAMAGSTTTVCGLCCEAEQRPQVPDVDPATACAAVLERWAAEKPRDVPETPLEPAGQPRTVSLTDRRRARRGVAAGAPERNVARLARYLEGGIQ
ncbi:hypothetical protein ACFXDJ_06645 [Streptomyces sp. NPDC059443]|uniref:hypothetical protein n=1 Tax=unclassified Streptomyces TaxID=2593676 RepID=UPI00368D6633